MTERFERIHVHLPALAAYAIDPGEQRLADREFVILADDQELEAAMPDIEVLVGFRFPTGVWGRADNLKLVQIPGAGVDSIVSQPDLPDGVAICNASGAHEPEMSEFIIALLHATTYRIPRITDQQREHRWRMVVPVRALSGSRLCIVGLGTIGQSVARRAAALGMDVVGVRHSGRPVDGVGDVVRPVDRLDVLRGSNALVVLTPLTEESRGLIGAAELDALAPGAIVVDVSRGNVMDLDALTDRLESGHISAAAVDVFPTEPLPKDDPLWEVPNLLVTPHTAGSSADYPRRIASRFADNLLAFERGDTPPGIVDRTLGY